MRFAILPFAKAFLGAAIGGVVAVIIQMVAADICQRRRRQANSIQPPLRDAVRGRLNRRRLASAADKIAQQTMQTNRAGCGVFQRAVFFSENSRAQRADNSGGDPACERSCAAKWAMVVLPLVAVTAATDNSLLGFLYNESAMSPGAGGKIFHRHIGGANCFRP